MKYNKTKTLMAAAAIAATAPMSVLAEIDMDGAVTQKLKYNDQLKGALDANGKIEVTKDGTDINVTGSSDFSIGAGESRIYRFDLTGATFEGAISLTQEESIIADGNDATTTNAGVLQNVADQGATAMFLVSADAATNDIDLTDDFDLVLAKLDIDPTATVNLKYSMYADVANASAQTNVLATKNFDMASFVQGSNYAIVVEAAAAEATVASSFSKFGTGKITDTLDSIGKINTDNVLLDGVAGDPLGTINNAGAATTVALSITDAQTLTITGDVSVGTFTTNDNADCSSGTAKACTAAADNGSCTVTATATRTVQHVCLSLAGATAAGDVLAKGDYSIAFSVDSGMDASLGSVSYDTTTVEIPYITTYSGYNQRIFLDNRGTTAAEYTTTFTSENGVTSAAGSAAAGSLPAGEMTAIKATDLVTFTGGSRGTGTIEVEAQNTKLKVVTQIVDLGTGMTDTILLYPSTQSTAH